MSSRKSGLAATLAVVVILVVKSIPANAQTAEPLDPSTARIHVGPLYVSPSLLLKELGVDTNVFNSTDDAKSDFTATLTPQAQFWMSISRRLVFRGTGGADLIYYATFANQRSINGTFDVRADVPLNRLTFFVGDSLVNTRDRPTYEIDIRPRHTDHSTSAGLNLKLHDKWSLEVSGRESQLRYDPTAVFDGVVLAESLDHNTEAVAVEGKYRWTPYTTFSLRGESSRDRFTEDSTRDSNSVTILPGVTFSPRALISGFAAVGVRRFEALAPGVPDNTSVIASAGLSYRLNGATILNTTIDRSLGYSYQGQTPYYIQNNIGVTVRRQLVGRFDATVGALRSVYDYKSVTTAAIPAPENPDSTTTSYSFEVGYRANRKTRVGLGVESWHRSSDQRSDLDYTGFRLRTTATVAF